MPKFTVKIRCEIAIELGEFLGWNWKTNDVIECLCDAVCYRKGAMWLSLLSNVLLRETHVISFKHTHPCYLW